MKREDKYHVTESISGYWYYHLSKKGINGQALCGAHTMNCSVPFSAWGYRGHLREQYCNKCLEIAKATLLNEQAEKPNN